ncbi:hypothetical protein [Sorangium sp. So ce1097]|uniref:hypothetical protein n=1 Tax=Sorangium sp. So ce1097 TaxID=3133330 RepID=UPI003F6487E6
MSSEQPPRERGLPSVHKAREARAKLRLPPAKFWGYTALILAVSAILHWKWSQGQIESARQKLMARQRAVAVELGPRWFPMRDRVEGWTLELAQSAGADLVDHEALKSWNFRELAGIYLRLRVDEATSVEAVRKNAQQSLRDAFTACLLRVPNPNPLTGAECKRTRDCPQGEYCNEAERCSRPAQPFNLRVAYRTMHVLSDEWVRDTQDASAELRLRLLESSFEDTMRDDVPLAAELLTRAQYYLLVLDEPVEGTTTTEALLAAPHMARVGVWRLSDGKQILRVRREASGNLIGGTPSVEADVLAARQRQANSCALALAVREAMGDTTAAVAEPH